jgi:protein-S-isoprenylcysteine O-methyltransferase Ste14
MDNGYAARMARLRVPLGLALGVIYLILAQPTVRLLVIGAAIALGGLLLRAWAAGLLVKNDRLATDGPYAWTRNPLYLGSLLIGIGLVVAGASWIMVVAFLLFFLAVYWPVIRREEAGLRERYGEDFERYAKRVPLFVPGLRKGPASGDHFHWSRYKKNREYEAALGYAAVIVFLAAKMMLR